MTDRAHLAKRFGVFDRRNILLVRMIEKLTIRNFKSIRSTELELGRVNVFIGANGSGKSNLLEALGVLAASAFGRIDDESIVRRGCRPGGYFRPLFKECSPEATTTLSANGSLGSYSVDLASPQLGKPSRWEFRREVLVERNETTPLVERSESNESKGDPAIGLAALKLAELDSDRPAAKFLRELAAFSIYSPDTAVLRGLLPDPQNREPVGLAGGRLGIAINELQNQSDTASKIVNEFKIAIPWFGGFATFGIPLAQAQQAGSVSTTSSTPTQFALGFIDRFFGTEGSNRYLLGTSDVNEGVLYVLFLSVLCLHKASPMCLALDNGDHSLNPLLARHLVHVASNWILESNENRQLLLTTHNPLVLDGLSLQDERVRLFIVDRDDKGATYIRRFLVTEKHKDLAAKGWTLSRMWVNKLIGGVPDV